MGTEGRQGDAMSDEPKTWTIAQLKDALTRGIAFFNLPSDCPVYLQCGDAAVVIQGIRAMERDGAPFLMLSPDSEDPDLTRTLYVGPEPVNPNPSDN
jgi:hypothetical protein